jgi:hypothetical protein
MVAKMCTPGRGAAIWGDQNEARCYMRWTEAATGLISFAFPIVIWLLFDETIDGSNVIASRVASISRWPRLLAIATPSRRSTGC